MPTQAIDLQNGAQTYLRNINDGERSYRTTNLDLIQIEN